MPPKNRAEYNKNYDLQRKREGLCITCSNFKRPGETRLRCDDCREKIRLQKKKKRDTNLNIGSCQWCYGDRVGNTLYCEKHWLMSVSAANLGSPTYWLNLLEKLREQNYTCYYTHENLLLGVNTSLDHKYPKSKHPNLQSDINNVVWCLKKINYMKRDMDEAEFVHYCEIIGHNFSNK